VSNNDIQKRIQINNIVNNYKMMEEGLYKKLETISYSLAVASILIILFTSGSTSSSVVTSLQYSYIILSSSMLFLFGLMWSKIGNATFMSKLITLLPILMLVITSLAVAIILFMYLDRITKGVSDYYGLFINTSTMITIVQLMIMYRAVNGNEFIMNNVINGKTFSLMMLLATINIITIVTLGVVLKNYTTDC
jgi:hypothetical protein